MHSYNNIVIDNSYSRVGIVTTVKRSIILSNVPRCFAANTVRLIQPVKRGTSFTLYWPGLASMSLVFITSTGCVIPVAIVP